MSAVPDPENMSLLAKVITAGSAVVVPIWIARSWLENRFAKKVGKDDFAEFTKRFDEHCAHDREIQGKLFDKIDEVKDILINQGRR